MIRKLVVWALLLSPQVWAEQADLDALNDLLSKHRFFGAQFQQYTLSEGDMRQELASGQFWVAQPDRFRWETQTPFPQLIVSDGEHVWIYDEDLAQVTERSVNGSGAITPAAILGGDLSEIGRTFEVRLLSDGDAGTLFELVPDANVQVDFQRLKLLFNNEQLSELLIEDSLGQRSLIMLDQLERYSDLEKDLFQFELPDGVDLIQDSAG